MDTKSVKTNHLLKTISLLGVMLLTILIIGGFMFKISTRPHVVFAVGSKEAPIEININTVLSDGDGFTYADSKVTIIENGYYKIFGDTTPTTNILAVSIGLTEVFITIENVNIDLQGKISSPSMIVNGSNVYLTLLGTNTFIGGTFKAGLSYNKDSILTIDGPGSLSAFGGGYSPGIGSNHLEMSGTLIINGGNINAVGGSGSAGIGGGFSSSVGDIIINGGNVFATGGGAGIGCGESGNLDNITINGGNIYATGGSGSAGIGTGVYEKSHDSSVTITGGYVYATSGVGGTGIGAGQFSPGCSVIIDGNAIVIAESITDKTNLISGILFEDSDIGSWLGDDLSINYDATILADKTIVIPNQHRLIIEEGNTLNIEGFLYAKPNQIIANTNGYGNLELSNGLSTITSSNQINLADPNPVRVGDGWYYENNTYTIIDGGNVIITGNALSGINIAIDYNTEASITLSGVTINDLTLNQSPLLLKEKASLVIELTENNTLMAGDGFSGILVPNGTSLTIFGSGALTVSGGSNAAGIGAAGEDGNGLITINGGMITSTGGKNAAGIGSNSQEGESITITGGIVNAFGGLLTGGINCGQIFTLDGWGLVIISKIMCNTNLVKGILFLDNEGFLYGDNVTINYNWIGTEKLKLTIPSGSTLTIGKDYTLKFNGYIYANSLQVIHNGNYGPDYGTFIYNNKYRDINSNEIDLSDNFPQNVGNCWRYANGIFTILDGADVIISGITADKRIVVAANAIVKITLANA